MSKVLRQKTILAVLEQRPATTQEQLQRALAKRGIRVGQATLSRDIRDLGLVKSSRGYGVQMEASADPGLPPAPRLVREFVQGVRAAQNLLVLRTAVGSAQPVAAALDEEAWPGTIGTIAGDDTVLIICTDSKSARKLAATIRRMQA